MTLQSFFFALFLTSLAPAVGAWEYRLAGGSTTYGRLEVRPSSTASWGTVCDDLFGLNDARVACRSLGLTSVTVAYRTVSTLDERGTGATYMDNLACFGSEQSLDRCTYVGQSNEDCSHWEDVVLACGTTTVPPLLAGATSAPATPIASWEYRLVGGSSTFGRLEVRPSSTSTWGTVCDDFFGSNDARVACRSLGLSTTSVGYRTVSSAERGTGITYMDNLACVGTESTLASCTFVGSSGEDCSNYEDVVLSCGSSTVPALTSVPATPSPTSSQSWEYRLAGGSTNYGRLEVRPSSADTWGTVCDDWFSSNDARVACRSLGLTTDTVGYRTVTAAEYGSGFTYMDDLGCTGTEATLDRCGFTGRNSEDCAHSEDVAISCGSATVPALASTSPVAPPTTPDSWEYRLVGGNNNSTYGRLEVRPSTSSPWGTVCDDVFGDTDARVACRSLGLSTSSVGYRTVTSGEQGTGFTYMDNLACTGNEAALGLCTFVDAANEDCSHSEDVVLSCTSSAVPPLNSSSAGSSLWQYRLAGGSSTYGRLEVRPSSSSGALWGTVCDDLFSAEDAVVACRALGLPTNNVGYRTVRTSSEYGTGPTYMDNLGCSGVEAHLGQCPFVDQFDQDCTHGEDVVLSCGSTSMTQPIASSSDSWEYRLAGGTSTYGRLEVRPSSSASWGTVCDDLFSLNDALVACSSLGLLTSSVGYRTVASTEIGSGATYMDNLACTGTEQSLDRCRFVDSTSEDCSHFEDVVLSCSGSVVPSLSPMTNAPPSPTPPHAWEYRLVGGSTTFGRLEARPWANATWGTVCDDYFGTNDAFVACRSLGLSTTTVGYRTVYTAFEQGTGVTYLDDLRCLGNEQSLDQCSYVGQSSEDCSHFEDVVISCGTSTVPSLITAPIPTGSWEYRLVGPLSSIAGDASTYGRLEVRPSPASSWGTVCDDFFDLNDARVACRTLGLSTTTVSYRTAAMRERGSGSIYMDDVACDGSEQSLEACYFLPEAQENCGHSEDVVLACGLSSVPYFVPSPAQDDDNDNSTWEYRLAAGSSTHGRLEIRPSASAAWGTVCDDSFGAADARVACRTLGLATATVAHRTARTAERGAAAQPIYMDDVACAGSEQRLDVCGFTPQARENCGHHEDVVVACGASSVPETATWQLRLAGGSSGSWGRLEARASYSAAWGTVCGAGWGAAEARSVCQALGLASTVAAFRAATAAERASPEQPVAQVSVACAGWQSQASGCALGTAAAAGCAAHAGDVVVACGVAAVPGNASVTDAPGALAWQYRLAGGASDAAGRLEALPPSGDTWGTVCDDLFGPMDAIVACRSLGFATGSSRTVSSSERGARVQPIHMDNVGCGGTEAALDLCPFVSQHNCGHSEDVWLTCSGGAVATTPAPPSEPWGYRLAGGEHARTGRLEVRAPGSSAGWGTVCDDAFGRADAVVACRALGLPTSPVSYRTAPAGLQGAASQAILMDDVGCRGTEARLDVCARAASHNCGHTEDVALTCGEEAVAVESEIRLSGNGWRSIFISENETRMEQLRAAVQADIAALLAIAPASLVKIRSLRLGSLVVDFAVNASSVTQAAAFATAINATAGQAASGAVFAASQAVYARDTTEGRAGEQVAVSDAAAVPAETQAPATARDDKLSSSDDSSSLSSLHLALIIVGVLVVIAVVAGAYAVTVLRRPVAPAPQRDHALAHDHPVTPPVNIPMQPPVVLAAADVAPPPAAATGSAPLPSYPAPYPPPSQTNASHAVGAEIGHSTYGPPLYPQPPNEAGTPL